MKIALATILDMPADEVWQRVLLPETLFAIAAPLVHFRFVANDQPVRWTDGERFAMALSILGFIPFGKQWIVPSVHSTEASPWPLKLRDCGHSSLIERWDHWITVDPNGIDQTFYRDDIEIRAGILTPFVWCFAMVFYYHRQRRWRKLASEWARQP